MSCPICAKPAEKAYRPFCSRRCANVDLGHWLGETYRMPVEEEPAEDAVPHDLSDQPSRH
ncbi:MAG: DNA gyrase inhibitor YacG [Pseudomonadota bacterium]